MKHKLVFISSIASPHQLRFAEALNRFFETRFWFYDRLHTRASWWAMPLGALCALIPGVRFKSSGRYWTRSHLQMLRRFNPDIMLLGGFSIPANYLAYRWARRRQKPVVVLTEVSRSASGRIRGKSLAWKLISWLYRDVSAIMTMTPEALDQFRSGLGPEVPVLDGRYATDLDAFLQHPFREPKAAYTLLFANRLTDIYNPLAAIRILADVCARYPATRMLMNALGGLRAECEALIASLGLQRNIEFLDHIRSWDELHLVYRQSDILLLPARYSAGNFTIYEAMASGMGLVVSEGVQGNGKLIEQGVNGFRLPQDQLAAAVMHYIGQPGLLQRHGAINRALVRPLGPEGTAELYARLLEPFLTQKNTQPL